MEWSIIESRWTEYASNAKLRWSRIPDERLEQTRGSRDKLSHAVQEVYTLTRDEAERQIAAWLAKQPRKAQPAATPRP
ncbi:MAG: CsbD family protein [Betaproteobacteria bacterium]